MIFSIVICVAVIAMTTYNGFIVAEPETVEGVIWRAATLIVLVLLYLAIGIDLMITSLRDEIRRNVDKRSDRW